MIKIKIFCIVRAEEEYEWDILMIQFDGNNK